MNLDIITRSSIERRKFWIEEISRISGNFGEDTERVESELRSEFERDGVIAILDHLRLCGAIPEGYDHDSSEEKLYSKYTDALLAIAFRYLGLTSIVLTERADSADVEVVGNDYSFVADAKVFRLSRTAKNAKDFKVESMDKWKEGKPYAVVVCPLYQLPLKNSQIYHQAASRNVAILSYSHLAVILSFCYKESQEHAQRLLGIVFRTIEALNPDKDATTYFLALNNALLDFDRAIHELWLIEKKANTDAIKVSKEESLEYLARKRENIMRMCREQAINQLIKELNNDGREKKIRSVSDNKLLSKHRDIN
jgi:type II restriction enzyme